MLGKAVFEEVTLSSYREEGGFRLEDVREGILGEGTGRTKTLRDELGLFGNGRRSL